MREIKFRGKRLDNGEWVYGSLLMSEPQEKSLEPLHCFIFPLDKGYHRVIPDTVGQFAGRHDKNGVEIYEGDFITAYNGRIKGPVIFDKRGLAFGIPNGPNEIYQFSMNFLESKDIEIIGNIYENPELLKENGQ